MQKKTEGRPMTLVNRNNRETYFGAPLFLEHMSPASAHSAEGPDPGAVGLFIETIYWESWGKGPGSHFPLITFDFFFSREENGLTSL